MMENFTQNFLIVTCISGTVIFMFLQFKKFQKQHRTVIEKTGDLWWEMESNPVTRNSAAHQSVGAELDMMLLNELSKAWQVIEYLSIFKYKELNDEAQAKFNWSNDIMEDIFRSWYDHRPVIKKFFDDRSEEGVVQELHKIFKKAVS